MKKELPIVAPEGYEIDKERMVFVPKEIDLFPDEKKFCKSWKYYDEQDNVYRISITDEDFATKIFAFTKLIELRDEVNRRDGFVVDWKNPAQQKWCVEYYYENRQVENHQVWQRPFAFQTKEIAKQFAEKYKDLIDQCPDLI